MGVSVLKRLLFALTAVAFVFATVVANCAGATWVDNASAMTAPMKAPCSDCPDKAPMSELAKMGCGALACAGIVALPARYLICLPDFGKRLHPPSAVKEMAGLSLAPDPFPPKPITRV